MREKMSKQPPAPTASTIGPCPAIIFHKTELKRSGGPNEREYHVVSKGHYQVEYS